MIRPVAHGLRLSSPVSTTSATGYVHVCICAARTTKTTWDFPASISEMSNMAWYARYTLSQLTQKPILIVNKFLDSVANRYVDTANNGTKSGDNPPSGAVVGTTFGQIQVANGGVLLLLLLKGRTLLLPMVLFLFQLKVLCTMKLFLVANLLRLVLMLLRLKSVIWVALLI